jgi:hypothetical protein
MSACIDVARLLAVYGVGNSQFMLEARLGYLQLGLAACYVKTKTDYYQKAGKLKSHTVRRNLVSLVLNIVLLPSRERRTMINRRGEGSWVKP